MPFYLYQKERINTESSRYIRKEEISLAGKNVIYNSLIKTGQLIENQDQGDLKWHLSESDLLSTAIDEYLSESALPNDYAIVIDLKPKDKKRVSLYELKDIWGYSYSPDYTPIALRLETLAVDLDHPNPDALKQRFETNDRLREPVHEFLYLRGGSGAGNDSGTWNWGQVGSVNGALLWPDALKFFFKEIKISIKAYKKGRRVSVGLWKSIRKFVDGYAEADRTIKNRQSES